MRSKRTRDGAGAGAEDIHAVRPIDRRSGLPMRSNGALVTVSAPFPDEAAAKALEGRNPEAWEVRIERLAAVQMHTGPIP